MLENVLLIRRAVCLATKAIGRVEWKMHCRTRMKESDPTESENARLDSGFRDSQKAAMQTDGERMKEGAGANEKALFKMAD